MGEEDLLILINSMHSFSRAVVYWIKLCQYFPAIWGVISHTSLSGKKCQYTASR